ncbi:ABC transporter permease [Planctomycetota bacterium]|nr:ABC transporter permease [Planctomycetota bacterium]
MLTNKNSDGKSDWIKWLIVFVCTMAGTSGLAYLLSLQDIRVGAAGVSIAGGIFAVYWLVKGLVKWRHIGWVKNVSVVAIASLLACSAFIFNLMDLENAGKVVFGVYAMGVSMYVGIQLVRWLLSAGHPVIAIARTLVDEAIRMKVPLIFIVVLVLLVPILPFVIDTKDLLKYRISTFITASMFVTSVSLSLMTLFLAVQTITSEIQHRQIYLSLTKSVSRVQYLLGKWLGIVMLNAVLIVVCGIAIYSFTMFLSKQDARDLADRAAVDQQILVARQATHPKPLDKMELASLFKQRIQKLRLQDPDVYGQPGSDIMDMPEEVMARVQQEIVEQWFSLSSREEQTYLFTGLLPAKEYGQTLQMRLYPKALGSTPDRMVTLQIKIAGLPYQFDNIDLKYQMNGVKLAEDTYHVLDVSPDMIDDLGQMEVTIKNPVLRTGEQPTINFKKGDGLEIYYRVGSFESNLAKSMVMVWLRLVFLAMLGLAMGSFLGFPTACLGALLIYFAASGSEFLFESLDNYAAFPKGEMSWGAWVMSLINIMIAKFQSDKPEDGVKILIRLVGSTFMNLIPRFGYYSPTVQLSEGHVIRGKEVGDAALWLGVVWTFVVGFIAYLIFRGRELARVTV